MSTPGTRPRGQASDLLAARDAQHVVTTDLSKQAAGVAPTPTLGGKSVPFIDLLRTDKVQEELRQALAPFNVTVERFTRVCLTAMEKKRQLLLVHPALMMDAIMRCAQLGLEPETALGHVFLAPIQDDDGQWVIEWILGYKGMRLLIQRSPEIDDIAVKEVRLQDEYAYEQGTDAYLMHKQALAERGPIEFFYVLIWMAGAERPRFEIVTLDEIEERRQMSRAVREEDLTSAWFTNELPMQMKTCLRIIYNQLPIGAEAAEAARDDGIVISTTDRPEGSVPAAGTEPQPPVEGQP